MSWGLQAPPERQVAPVRRRALPKGLASGIARAVRAPRPALEKPLQPFRRADCARSPPARAVPPPATRTIGTRPPAPAPGRSNAGGSLTRRGSLPGALPPDVQGGCHADNRDESHDHPGDVALYLVVPEHGFIPAQGIADPRQDRTPDQRPEGRITDELRQRHPL